MSRKLDVCDEQRACERAWVPHAACIRPPPSPHAPRFRGAAALPRVQLARLLALLFGVPRALKALLTCAGR